MQFFYVNESVSFKLGQTDGSEVFTTLDPVNGKPNPDSIYVGTGSCYDILMHQVSSATDISPSFKVTCLNTASKRQIYSLSKFPTSLSNFDGSVDERSYVFNDVRKTDIVPTTEFIDLEDRIVPHLGKKTIKIFAINGMGTGLGDGMIGLSALNVLRKRLEKHFDEIIIDVGHCTSIASRSHKELYLQESIINNVRYLPIKLKELCEYDMVIDNSALIIRSNFGNQPMVDFFLENMSINPASVSDEDKNIVFRTNQELDSVYKNTYDFIRGTDNKKIVFLNTVASTDIRCMPLDSTKKIIKSLLDSDPSYSVVTWQNFGDNISEINEYLGDNADRHVNLAYRLSGHNFQHYASAIKMADALVTVDSSAYHLANAFNVPSVVIFQTIEPSLRIRYYSLCNGIELSKNNNLSGVHMATDKSQVDYIHGLWKKFDNKKITVSLRNIIASKESMTGHECPVCSDTSLKIQTDRYGSSTIIHCHKCDHEFDVSENEKKTKESTSLAEGELVQDALNKALLIPRMETLIEFSHLSSKKGRHLDISNGMSGTIVSYMLHMGHDSYGIESSEVCVNSGIRRLNLDASRLLHGDVSSLDNITETFDLITMFNTLESEKELDSVLESITNRLNVGGTLLISVPNKNRMHYRTGMKKTIGHTNLSLPDFSPYVFNRFSTNSIESLLKFHDLTIVKSTVCGLVDKDVVDICGAQPSISFTPESSSVIELPSDKLYSVYYNHFNPLISKINNAGDYITIIAKK